MTKWRWKSGPGLGQTQKSYGINNKNDSSEWYINIPQRKLKGQSRMGESRDTGNIGKATHQVKKRKTTTKNKLQHKKLK